MTEKFSDFAPQGVPPAAGDYLVGFLAGGGPGSNARWPGSTIGARIQLVVDTTFYVATTGSDVTGDGTVGNPWKTITHAINYVMYNVTGQGVNVTIQVADGTYNENITLGPHQIFALGSSSYYSAPRINFSSTTTPGNVVIAPLTRGPTWAGTEGATISANNSVWQLTGGFSITQGASTNINVISAFNGANLNFGGQNFAGVNTAILFNDAVDIAFDAEFNSVITCGDRAVSIEFASTVGTLALVDDRSHIEFYGLTTIQFDVDPGFVGSLGGMWGANFSGGCTITSRATYSGSTAAAPSKSLIGFGNYVYDRNDFMGIANINCKPANQGFGWYNGVTQFIEIKDFGGGHVVTLLNLTANAPVLEMTDTSSANWQSGPFLGATNDSSFYNFIPATQAGWQVLTDGTTSKAWMTLGNDGVLGFCNAPGANGTFLNLDTGLSRVAAATAAFGNGQPGDFSGALKLTNLHVEPVAIASLPGSPATGDFATVNDALAPVAGSPVASGGSATAGVWYNGAAWNVFAV